jgi:hypothetical protein
MDPSVRRESESRSPADDLGGAAPSAAEPANAAEPAAIPIVCSLTAVDVQTRVDEWHVLAGRIRERQPIDGGLRLIFESTTPHSVIADLAAREHACCPFLDFTVTADDEVPVLEVRALAAAQAIIDVLVGGAAEGTRPTRSAPGTQSSTGCQ